MWKKSTWLPLQSSRSPLSTATSGLRRRNCPSATLAYHRASDRKWDRTAVTLAASFVSISFKKWVADACHPFVFFFPLVFVCSSTSFSIIFLTSASFFTCQRPLSNNKNVFSFSLSFLVSLSAVVSLRWSSFASRLRTTMSRGLWWTKWLATLRHSTRLSTSPTGSSTLSQGRWTMPPPRNSIWKPGFRVPVTFSSSSYFVSLFMNLGYFVRAWWCCCCCLLYNLERQLGWRIAVIAALTMKPGLFRIFHMNEVLYNGLFLMLATERHDLETDVIALVGDGWMNEERTNEHGVGITTTHYCISGWCRRLPRTGLLFQLFGVSVTPLTDSLRPDEEDERSGDFSFIAFRSFFLISFLPRAENVIEKNVISALLLL